MKQRLGVGVSIMETTKSNGNVKADEIFGQKGASIKQSPELLEQEGKGKAKVLIGSPIHQDPQILHAFLDSLAHLEHPDFLIEFILLDDNENTDSFKLLYDFKAARPDVSLFRVTYPQQSRMDYRRDKTTHYWNEDLIWKVAALKNNIIRAAIDRKADYLFLVDSDLVLHPSLLKKLIGAKKDIISEIFWTRWSPDTIELPNVWAADQYSMIRKNRGEELSSEEAVKRQTEFLNGLRTPGIHEVGGLGACTLISRKALLAGVHFGEIKNLSFWGEDRHFCIRAAALGFPLYVDTNYPAYHIYRKEELAGVEAYKKRAGYEPKPAQAPVTAPRSNTTNNKLTLSMVMKNEAGRYLQKVLEQHRQYIDEAVIIDDGSCDNSCEICSEMLKGIPVHIIRNTESKFNNEIYLRKQQWNETVKTNPGWILNLDADEMFEERFANEVRSLISLDQVELYCFRLFDFWDETHYREDQYWKAHFTYRPFLLRYRQDFEYKWNETPQHCGRFPANILTLPRTLSDLRLKHFGWARPENRREKYDRYMHLDPNAQYGWKEQYESILDPSPNLVEWKESMT